MAWQEELEEMLEVQIKARGVRNPLVLKALSRIPRHEFVPQGCRKQAYRDRPLPIGEGQTISQPFIVALMTAKLRLCGGESVLEIGTGLGYQAAVLSQIASLVYTVERLPSLADRARENFARLGLSNIFLKKGDGTLGWPEKAPFEGIMVTATGPLVPGPLKEQLAVGGRLVMPVGSTRQTQRLIRLTKGQGGHFQQEDLLPVLFVPLRGKHGWQAGF